MDPRHATRSRRFARLILGVVLGGCFAGCEPGPATAEAEQETAAKTKAMQARYAEQYDRLQGVLTQWGDHFIHPGIHEPNDNYDNLVKQVSCDDDGILARTAKAEGRELLLLSWNDAQTLVAEAEPPKPKKGTEDVPGLTHYVFELDPVPEVDFAEGYALDQLVATLKVRPFVGIVRVHERNDASSSDEVVFTEHGEAKEFAGGWIYGTLTVFDWRTGQFQCGLAVRAESSNRVVGSLGSDLHDNFIEAVRKAVPEISQALTLPEDLVRGGSLRTP